MNPSIPDEGLQLNLTLGGTAESSLEQAQSTSGSGTSEPSNLACTNCGEQLFGEFCSRCGEKQPGARDLSLRHFIAEALNELTSVEHSKLFRTVAALLFKPGFLTVEYFAGRRGRYLKPLNLCLGIFALSIFAYSASKSVSMFNFEQIVQTEKDVIEARKVQGRGIYERIITRISSKRNMTREATIEAINERWSRNFSLFQLPEIALFALMLSLVYFFSSRYLVEHLVFSLHFLSFTSLSVVLLWPIYLFLGIRPTTINMIVAAGKFLLDIVYMFFALRVFYHEPFWKAVLRAPILFAGYFVIYIMMFLSALVITLVGLSRG